MNTGLDVIAIIAPWQSAIYQDLATPLTLAKTEKKARDFDRHRIELQARGDAAAVSGASTALRLSLLEVAAVDATTVAMLTRKVRILGQHHAVWADDAMTAMMVDTAVENDMAALAVAGIEKARLRLVLRGGR